MAHLYLLFNTGVLLFLHVGIYAKVLPDLTVLANHNSIFCIARNDTSAIAIAGLGSETPSGSRPKWLGISGAIPVCNITSCVEWYQDNFFKQMVYQLQVRPLVNFYWEELNIVRLNPDEVTYDLPQDSWLMDVSILAERDVYFNVTSGGNNSYYWLILGGWANRGSAIRVPILPMGFQNVSEHKGAILNRTRWMHFRLSWDSSANQFEVIRWGYNDNQPFLSCDMDSPESLHIFGRYSTSLVRLHYYSVWGAAGGEASFRSKKFVPQSERLCFIVTYHIQDADSKIFVRIDNDQHDSRIVNVLQDVGDSWKEQRIEVNLSELWPNWKERHVSIELHTEGEHHGVYIAGIQECNPEGDVRLAVVGWTHNNKKKLTCQLVRYDQSYSLGDPQVKKQGCGDSCAWTCSDYIPTMLSCQNVIICKPSQTGVTSCFCSPGYKGKSCYYTVCYPVFQDKLKCFSSTVDSVTVSAPQQKYRYCYYQDVTPAQYRLEYKRPGSQKWNVSALVSLADKGSVTVSELNHATKYELRAVVGDEYGYFYVQGSIPTTVCSTSCTAPHVIAEPAETNITLRLQELDNTPCPLSWYVLEFDAESLPPESKELDIFRVNNLKPFTEHYFRLWLSNQLVQDGTINTTEAAPGPPIELQVSSKSSTNLTVCWKNPLEMNGILRYFILEVTCLDTKLKKGIDAVKDCNKSDIATKPQQHNCYEFQKLLPSTKYKVSICGKTVKPGPCEILQEETQLAEPDIGPGIGLLEDSVTTSTFVVSLPPQYPFLTTTSAYFLILTSEDDNAEFEQESVNAKQITLRQNLLKAANVNIDHSWIIDELQLMEQQTKYTVGKNKKSNGSFLKETFWNHPLRPGVNYNVTLLLVNKDEHISHYAVSRLPVSVETAPLPTTSSPHNEPKAINDGNDAVWLALLVLLVLPPIVYFIYKRKKKYEAKAVDTLQLKGEEFQSSNEEEVELALEDSPTAPQQAPSQRLSRRVAISELESYVKMGLASGEFQRQHALFPRGQTKPWEYGKKPQNTSKNRYGNLIAYDETRVKLKKLPNDEFSDYINANYIDGYNSSKCYIATQGPKPNTVNDFWRMIWQEQVHVIAMLTNVIENGKRKCEQYWPDVGNEKTFGPISVHNIASDIFADYTFRQLNMTYRGKTRKVHHLHFTSWPDHGVPLYPQSVAMFLKKLLAIPPGPGPIVVHCSAGVGRTGTIILSDVCLRMAAAEGHVDILHYQQQLREQRANLVDNLEPTSLPFNSTLPFAREELYRSGKLQQQFKRLSKLDWQDKALIQPSSALLEQQAAANEHKNRFQHIVPGAKGHVFISRYPLDDASSDYINAVYVDGFRAKNQFIATQFPLENTVPDFWRLLVEKSIGLVIVLNEMDFTDKSVCQFWPLAQESMNPAPDVTVTHRQKEENPFWVLHILSVTHSTKQTLKLLQLKSWATSNETPPSPELLLNLWQESERLYMGKAPIIVTCYDGATACGLFLALTFMVEKIKLEQECDPYHAVQTVRQNRPSFVPTLEQFLFLFDAAEKYLDDFQTYANFQ